MTTRSYLSHLTRKTTRQKIIYHQVPFQNLLLRCISFYHMKRPGRWGKLICYLGNVIWLCFQCHRHSFGDTRSQEIIYTLIQAWSTAYSFWYLISTNLNNFLAWESLIVKIYRIPISVYNPMLTESNRATSAVVNKINQGLFSGSNAKQYGTAYVHIAQLSSSSRAGWPQLNCHWE